MMSSHLLRLPMELLLQVTEAVARDGEIGDSATPESIRTLLALSRTCRPLHQLIFHEDRLWKYCARTLGIDCALSEVLYPGTSTLQRRSWLSVVKQAVVWSRPFDTSSKTPNTLRKKENHPESRPKREQARSSLPARSDCLRTIELIAPGEGTQRGPNYKVKHVTLSDDGEAMFFTPGAHGSGDDITGVIDPMKGTATILSKKAKTGPAWTSTPFPNNVGFRVEKVEEDYRVSQLETGRTSRVWDLGRRKPDRIVRCGDFLVATFCTPSEGGDNGLPTTLVDVARSLVCARSSSAGTEILWEYEITGAWFDARRPNASFPHLKNFHMTSKWLVCLVTRHSRPSLGNPRHTEFLVISLDTGAIAKKLDFPHVSRTLLDAAMSASRTASVQLRAGSNTAALHDFLLTDTHIVSGGAGGGLWVWNYTSSKSPSSVLGKIYGAPLYTISDPFAFISINGENMRRFYSSITLSVDGRYVGATMSDQLCIFDMVEKSVSSVWTNGRELDPNQPLMSNPIDDFPGGLWVQWKDWQRDVMHRDDEVGWEETASGVAYLTDVLNPQGIEYPCTRKESEKAEKETADAQKTAGIKATGASLLAPVLGAALWWMWS